MYVHTHVIPLPAKYSIKNLVSEDCYAVVFCLQMHRFLNSGFTTLLEEVCCYRYIIFPEFIFYVSHLWWFRSWGFGVGVVGWAFEVRELS